MARPACPCGAVHAVSEMFYVTVADAGKVGYLVGPFPDHAAALDKVDATRKVAERLDWRATFYAFGTTGVTGGDLRAGTLNA